MSTGFAWTRRLSRTIIYRVRISEAMAHHKRIRIKKGKGRDLR
jgi:hypothetical protein